MIFRRRTFGIARSKDWRRVRKEHLRKHPFCAVCGTKKRLEAHHCIPYHIDKSLELDPKNLITLCRKHHFLFGHLNFWASWNVDVKNNSKYFYEKIKNRP